MSQAEAVESESRVQPAATLHVDEPGFPLVTLSSPATLCHVAAYSNSTKIPVLVLRSLRQ